jgi:hypothetical protein
MLDGILRKFGISISQFYVLNCIHNNEKEALDYHAMLDSNFLEDLKILEGAELLEYDGDNSKPMLIDNYVLSQFFIDNFYLDIDKAGKEFYDAYPSYLEIDGRKVLTKKGDRDALMRMYCAGIGNDLEKHQQVLKALKIAEQQGSLNMAIRNFIESELYLDILDLLDKPNRNVEFRESI